MLKPKYTLAETFAKFPKIPYIPTKTFRGFWGILQRSLSMNITSNHKESHKQNDR